MTGVVVDISAAVAILVGEPEAEDLLAALGDGDPLLVSAATRASSR